VDLNGETGVPSGRGEWTEAGSGLTGTAGAGTDLFVDPASAHASLEALRLTFSAPAGDFQLRARVEVDFAGTYDAGALLVWMDDRTWAKLCLEYSPQRQPMVVSVVTRGNSDDANNVTVDGSTIWLRVSHRDGAYAYHASADGEHWDLVRHFNLGGPAPQVGFAVQSPLGDGCTARFGEIAFTQQRLAELRDGT
jgi:regulation of enolase protein 1 (concanavalin A-like superfamily)